jgi:hypothetical protein
MRQELKRWEEIGGETTMMAETNLWLRGGAETVVVAVEA